MAGRYRWWWVVALVASSGFLSGGYCSYRGYYTPGSSGGNGTQLSNGPINRFGSVVIDGSEYATTAASVTLDGLIGSTASLRVGQIALLTGTPARGTAAGTASSLVVTTKLVGPVTALDLAAATVTVLGQTVRITGDTSVGAGVAPTDPAGLLYGQIVAVDGYRTSGGLIASRFDAAAGTPLLRISGRVSQLNGTAQTFDIGGTTVNYLGVVGGLPPAVSNGSYVIASGSSVGGTATLNATQVASQPEAIAGRSGSGGALHGAVTRFATAADFDVAGQPVSTSSATAYSGGLAADLGGDAELQIAGQYDATGTLAATLVTFVPATPFRLVGSVDRIDTTARTFTVAGVALAVADASRWDDRSSAASRTFTYGELRTGDWLEVRGAATGAAAASARVVERRVAPVAALIELQDVVAGLADPALTLAGVAVDTRGATFRDVDGLPLTRSQFFAAASGRIVRARGALAGAATLVATVVALRN